MALVDLYDPDLYIAGPPHEVFAELRRTRLELGALTLVTLLVGGVGALLMVLLWMRLFPALAHVKRIAPEAGEAERSR